ncbi:histidine kinase [Paenibacillus sp. M1]|uniref:Histidine kinase n=1 Tax=Paenibacillus haidiansis TaxID=1574488 RepID=A0ABU7VV68_9BACL
MLYQGYRNIDSLLQGVNRISLTVYNDSEFYRLLEAGYEDISSNAKIYSTMNYIYSSMPDILQVYLYGVKNDKATLITQDIPKRWQSLSPYGDSVLPENETLKIQSTHINHNYGLTSTLPQEVVEQVFTLHRRIEKVPSTQVLGYLSIDVKLSALREIVEQLYVQGEENLFITDTSGRLIYSSDAEAIGKSLNADWYINMGDGLKQDQGFFERDDSVFIYQRIESAGADWMLFKQIPASYLYGEAKQSAMINALLFGVALLIIIVATVLSSIRITWPIKRLTQSINQVQATGNLEVDIASAGSDEIGVLTDRFREMMDTINNLILREYKLELTSKNNQLRALQAQINPHFLNNTLQIIGTLALEKNEPQIYNLISSLAKMMHYSMHNDDRGVTLKDELDHVKAYIELQKERFENRFSFDYQVEDSMMQLKMPKMILQPIVENYFKHGIDRKKSKGWIQLTATMNRQDEVTIIVRNNGAWIPEEKLSMLQRGLNASGAEQVRPGEDEVESRKPSIGLINVLTRLRLVYGENAELTVTNMKPVGVQIKLKFKIQNESESREDNQYEGANR